MVHDSQSSGEVLVICLVSSFGGCCCASKVGKNGLVLDELSFLCNVSKQD